MNSHEQILSLDLNNFMKERLELANPLLHPRELGAWIPNFKNFKPLSNDPDQLLWLNMRTAEKIAGIGGSAENFLLLFSGLTAGGKDTIRKRLIRLNPDLIIKPLSATTRDPREKDHEQNGVDYWFYNRPEFERMIKEGSFIEYVEQYGNLYGLPKHSLDEAIIQSSQTYRPLILTQVEVSAWNTIYDHMKNQYRLPVVSMFVLPQMHYANYTQEWLPSQRQDDYKERALRSTFELSMASSLADILVLNPWGTIHPGEEACNAIQRYSYELLPEPIEVSHAILQECQSC